MQRISATTLDASQDILRDITHRTGGLMNIHATMASSPAVLAAYAGISAVIADHGSLSGRVPQPDWPRRRWCRSGPVTRSPKGEGTIAATTAPRRSLATTLRHGVAGGLAGGLVLAVLGRRGSAGRSAP